MILLFKKMSQIRKILWIDGTSVCAKINCVKVALVERTDFFMFIHTIDENNRKALNVAMLSLQAVENGIEGVDFASILEVIIDYLKSNDKIFDKTA